MKKKIYILIIVCMIAMIFSGCRKYFGVTQANQTDSTTFIQTTSDATTKKQVVTQSPTTIPTPSPTQIPPHDLAKIILNDTESSLRVRSGPSLDYDIIGAINHDITVLVFSIIDGWCEINFDGVRGFCSQDYFAIDNSLTYPEDVEYRYTPIWEDGFEERVLPAGTGSKIGVDIDIDGDGTADGVTIDTNDDDIADAVKVLVKDMLVDVEYYGKEIAHNIVFATKENFTKKAIYSSYVVLLQKEVLDDLLKAQKIFAKDDYIILIYDAYRPLSEQDKLHKLISDDKFAQSIEIGSNHNRGTAVDITLIDKDGNEIIMPSDVYDFSEKSYRDNSDVSAQAKVNLEYMTDVMESCNFTIYKYEWWHFNHINAKDYALSDHKFIKVIKLRVK